MYDYRRKQHIFNYPLKTYTNLKKTTKTAIFRSLHIAWIFFKKRLCLSKNDLSMGFHSAVLMLPINESQHPNRIKL
jgi:hypothetical protein